MDRKNALDPKILRKINHFTKLLKKEKVPFNQLILWGSYAHGQPREYSDIDLCVISLPFGKDPTKERVKLGLLADKIDWRIEPHAYHPKNLAIEEDPFAYEIKRTGIVIKL